MENPRIDGERLWNGLTETPRNGATEKGGMCRPALTEVDRARRYLFDQPLW